MDLLNQLRVYAIASFFLAVGVSVYTVHSHSVISYEFKNLYNTKTDYSLGIISSDALESFTVQNEDKERLVPSINLMRLMTSAQKMRTKNTKKIEVSQNIKKSETDSVSDQLSDASDDGKAENETNDTTPQLIGLPQPPQGFSVSTQ